MSLIYCPECGHEISNAAVACPHCGRPLSAKPVVEATPVVAPVTRDRGVPNWVFIPLGIIGAVLLITFFVFMSRNSGDESNLNVNVSARRPAGSNSDRSSTTTTNVPGSSSGGTISVPPSADGQTVTVPGAQTSINEAPSKGTVVIDAKIAGRTGSPQPVRDEKFYLLDRDVESILSSAGLDPIEGQTLMNSFGLSVLYPERYGDFNRDALRAIKEHIKYSGTSNAAGKAELGNIEPDSYYLFAITKSGKGFAIWSSPVTINAGQNALNLTPQRLTEVDLSGAGD